MNYQQRLDHLVHVIQKLSMVRDMETLSALVRHAARELTGADGATFVLRDGDQCHYRDEDAIGPLWKGQRFPMSACVSGWVMQHREPVMIEDIYADPRVPQDAYRPTFVHSLVMVPIRTLDPIGAIGNYWAGRHRSTPEEVYLLRALADSTSVAMENVRMFEDLRPLALRNSA
jgi:GAF domain-containing protein